MSTIAHPPPSPSKRTFLRTIVTGIPPPEDRGTLRSRWEASQHPNPTPHAPAQGSHRASPVLSNNNGTVGRVASMVQGFEAVSLGASSRAYASIPLPPSPTKPAFGARPTPVHKVSADSTTSTAAHQKNAANRDKPMVSPTVPASFFQQQQQLRRNPPPHSSSPSSPTSPISASSPTDSSHSKENRAFAPRQPNALNSSQNTRQPNNHSSSTALSAAKLGRLGTPSAARPPPTPAPAPSEVSLGTMATRSSQSTHASSIFSGVTVEGSQFSHPSRRGTGSSAESAQIQHAKAVALSPAQARPAFVPGHARAQSAAAASQTPIYAVRASSLAPPCERRREPSPTPSRFTEALPASYPSTSAGQVAQSPTPAQLSTYSSTLSPALGYQPLPLEHSPVLQATTPRKTRARALTVGAGVPSLGRPTSAFNSVEAHAESAEQRRARIEREFESLVDEMQVPDATVRNKMLGLTLAVKEGMLAGGGASLSRSVNGCAASAGGRERENLADHRLSSSAGKSSSKAMRKTKSSGALRPGTGDGSHSAKRPGHSRTTSATSILLRSFGKSSGKAASKEVAAAVPSADDGEAPGWWASHIAHTLAKDLDPKEVGQLRGRLRTEAPGWVQDFIRQGGYAGLLARLKELLEVEWREEQHDDQLLHHLLRCFKALTLTPAGRRSLGQSGQTVFLPLANLLWSEKRPGDLPCRQVLVEMIQAAFEVQPEGVQPVTEAEWEALRPIKKDDIAAGTPAAAQVARFSRPVKGGSMSPSSSLMRGSQSPLLEDRAEAFSAARRAGTYEFVYSLMLGPPSVKEQAKVEFIQQTHRPRLMRTWVTEFCEIVRDYFWVYCHAQNPMWVKEQLDEGAIETPKVPSGMTGGVEAEAMAYAVSTPTRAPSFGPPNADRPPLSDPFPPTDGPLPAPQRAPQRMPVRAGRVCASLSTLPVRLRARSAHVPPRECDLLPATPPRDGEVPDARAGGQVQPRPARAGLDRLGHAWEGGAGGCAGVAGEGAREGGGAEGGPAVLRRCGTRVGLGASASEREWRGVGQRGGGADGR